MSVMDNFRAFKPPGPVAASFLADGVSLVRSIRGPVGGGKTVTCIFDGLRNASTMPVCTDGKIRFRNAIIGQTYGQIERNLYSTWFNWLPDDGGDWTEAEFTGGGGRFGKHAISWDVMRDGCRVQVLYEAIFAAIGEQAVENFMRGFEPTAFWLFEMDLLPEAVLPTAITRLGRYPRRADVRGDLDYRSYIIGDLNSPDVDSWYYRAFEEDVPAGFRQYVQPSGLSPHAENIANLPRGYYERQVQMLAKKPNLIKRMVKNEYAPSSDGQPVYPEYSDDRHLSREELAPVKGIPLKIGVDAGLRAPAAIIGQDLPNGQCLILGEVVPGRVGTKSFAALVRKECGDIAPGIPIEIGYCDPAGFSGGDSEDNQLAWAEQLMHELKIPIEPAPSNELDLRLDAVRDDLLANLDGETPALRISKRCKVLRKGFASHYRYAKRKQANTESLTPKPEKNDWSHIHDALQYLRLGVKGRYGVISGNRPGAKGGAQTSGGTSRIKNTTRIFG